VSVTAKIQEKFNRALDECAGECTDKYTGKYTGGQRGPFGVAVSGGSDSLALLILTQAWAQERREDLHVVTVDHQLRPESRAEALGVADFCAKRGLPHQILTWGGWDGQGNKAEAARDARYGLMQEWAKSQGITGLLLGHTQDDQAETFLMALARKSGVDGLSAMANRRPYRGIVLMRPLLSFARDGLREMLVACAVPWVDDPSNDDARAERIKMRHLLTQMAAAGVDRPAMVQVVQNLQSAQTALAHFAHDTARDLIHFVGGEIHVDLAKFLALPDETRFRLLAHVLTWLASAQNRPRQKSLKTALITVKSGQIVTLHGCVIYPCKDTLIVAREAAAIAPEKARENQIYDRHWRIIGPIKQGYRLAPLGNLGLAHCPQWRSSGMSRFGAMASPALWENHQLIAAPMLGLRNGWQITALKDAEVFFSGLLGH